MKFETPLIPGTLLRRYKRFLADIELEDGTAVTAHCANPGAMLGLNMPGLKVWVEPASNPKRKLRYSWRLVETGGHWAGIDTGVPNRIVGEALAAGAIPEFAALTGIRPEIRYGVNSRVDFHGRAADGQEVYIEVKNVHLMRVPGLAEFPDCVTARGSKHLAELAEMVRQGHRAVMLYCIQRDDCDRFGLATDLDPAYAAAFAQARAAGVEAMAWRCRLSTAEIALDRPIPIAENDHGVA